MERIQEPSWFSGEEGIEQEYEAPVADIVLRRARHRIDEYDKAATLAELLNLYHAHNWASIADGIKEDGRFVTFLHAYRSLMDVWDFETERMPVPVREFMVRVEGKRRPDPCDFDIDREQWIADREYDRKIEEFKAVLL